MNCSVVILITFKREASSSIQIGVLLVAQREGVDCYLPFSFQGRGVFMGK